MYIRRYWSVYCVYERVTVRLKYGLADYTYQLQEYFCVHECHSHHCALLKCCFLYIYECCCFLISTSSLELILQLCAYVTLYNTLHMYMQGTDTQEIHVPKHVNKYTTRHMYNVCSCSNALISVLMD